LASLVATQAVSRSTLALAPRELKQADAQSFSPVALFCRMKGKKSIYPLVHTLPGDAFDTGFLTRKSYGP